MKEELKKKMIAVIGNSDRLWTQIIAEKCAQIAIDHYKERESALSMSGVTCRIISGCSDCPFNYEYDMAIGYGCQLDSKNKTIRQSEKYQPITPKWCPIKISDVLVKYGR